MNPIIAILILAPLVLLSFAAPARAEIKTQEIDYKDGDLALRGFLAWDDKAGGAEKKPGVLVIHEWWGHNQTARDKAMTLAELGYVAFALDMYGKGVSADKPDAAQKLATPFYSDRALMRSRAAAGLKVLLDQKNVDPKRVAAIGYCFGGSCALELARSGADLAAVVVFHGGLSTPTPSDAKNIKGKVLICNGADDGFVKPEEKAAFHDEMRNAKVDYIFIDYAGALHAFTNPNAAKFGIPGIAYNEKADKRSWEHMKLLFAEAFGAK